MEILVAIAEATVLDRFHQDWEWEAPSYRTVLNMRCVCHHWLAFIDGCPSLWRWTGAIGVPDSVVLRKSGDAPLHVLWDATAREDRQPTLDSSHRWRALTIYRMGSWHPIIPAFNVPAPNLKTIECISHGRSVYPPTSPLNPGPIYHQDTPSITSVYLYQVHLPLTQFNLGILQHLTIIDPPNHLSILAEILSIIHKTLVALALITLELRGSPDDSDPTTGSTSQAPAHEYPCLRSLSLRLTAGLLCEILDSIADAPSLDHLECELQGGGDQHAAKVAHWARPLSERWSGDSLELRVSFTRPKLEFRGPYTVQISRYDWWSPPSTDTFISITLQAIITALPQSAENRVTTLRWHDRSSVHRSVFPILFSLFPQIHIIDVPTVDESLRRLVRYFRLCPDHMPPNLRSIRVLSAISEDPEPGLTEPSPSWASWYRPRRGTNDTGVVVGYRTDSKKLQGADSIPT